MPSGWLSDELLSLRPAAPESELRSLNALIEDYDDSLCFFLNGTRVVLDEFDPEITLLEYLRGIGLTGTKLGCAEGGCGACTVVVSQLNATTGRIHHASLNACIAPLISVDGKHIITVEGIGNVDRPHPAQERIARFNGSQCGFCTPGIVMSLYALLRNDPCPSEHDVEEAFDGNLCRCTGYRPILNAAQTFSERSSCTAARANGKCCMQDGDEDVACSKNAKIPNTFTPPGFKKLDPETELIFPPALRKYQYRPLKLGNKRKLWLRPVNLQQLLEIKDVYPAAKIIGGSTETQIEIKFKSMQYKVSVYVGDIAELRRISHEKDHLSIGGNISLTDLETAVKTASTQYGPVQGQVFVSLLKQLKHFAGRQIRNAGTPAGNLATASPISDLNPIFVASKAVIIARSLRNEVEIPMSEFFQGYRTTSLGTDQIIASIRIPATTHNEYFRAYKQAKRKDDDIAIVNAAIRVLLSDSGVVTDASLVYGGMAPTTTSAQHATEYLIGKQFVDSKTLEGVMDALEQDFDLRFGVPGGMATYRKSLALGFFYRFWYDVCTCIDMSLTENHGDQDCLSEIERDISQGCQDDDATSSYQQEILGKPKPHVAALKQCTGEAQYTDDLPVSNNELFGCLVLSTKAHAKIKTVRSEAALALPGVVRYIDHTDLPSPEANWWGAPVCDEVFLAVDEVHTAGQPIGMVLADTAQHATAGARAILIEYEELPAILTIEEAVEKESFFEHYRYIKKGDTKDAFAKADYCFSGVVRMGGQEHFYLETNACVAVPKPEDGEIEVFASTQNPSETYVNAIRDVAANISADRHTSRKPVASPPTRSWSGKLFSSIHWEIVNRPVVSER